LKIEKEKMNIYLDIKIIQKVGKASESSVLLNLAFMVRFPSPPQSRSRSSSGRYL
jgi:hypothetical protein